SRSPASSARQTPSIAAKTWTATGSMPSSSTVPMSRSRPSSTPSCGPPAFAPSTTGAGIVRGVERPVHHASPVAVPDTGGGGRGAAAGGRVWPAHRGHLRLGRRSGTGIAPDLGAGLGGSGGDGPADQSARQPARRVAPDRGGGRGSGTAQSVADDGGELPNGA